LATGDPWDHEPTLQEFTLPFTPTTTKMEIGGMHFDAVNRKLYVLQNRGERSVGCCTVKPLMHVFHVAAP
jgi:hypothetical protein